MKRLDTKCKKQPIRIVLTPKPKIETCAGDSQKKRIKSRKKKDAD